MKTQQESTACTSVMVFPFSSTKYLQFWPVPQTLPAGVVRGAAIVG
jgi:hypothetical protein